MTEVSRSYEYGATNWKTRYGFASRPVSNYHAEMLREDGMLE